MNEIQESAREMCNNEQGVELISTLTNVAASIVKETLQSISENPEISKQTVDLLESPQSSHDLNIYRAGLEEGRKTGHAEGRAKGVVQGAVTASLIALLSLGIKHLSKDKDKQEKVKG